MNYSKNEYFDAWLESMQTLQTIPLSEEVQGDGLFSPAEAGAVALTGSYMLAGGLMMTKHPVAMGAAGVILAIPDPVIVMVGVAILS
jgi:hypothetical protein